MILNNAGEIRRCLHKYVMEQCKQLSAPIQKNASALLHKENETLYEIMYLEATGYLLYLVMFTRPDILFAVETFSKFFESPKRTHWSMVKRLFI